MVIIIDMLKGKEVIPLHMCLFKELSATEDYWKVDN